ncbi:hypothetical protein NQ318_006055 [Aromia moschata]|uniref:Uncharacterized protein n=1 Tax=Aromia moschata TaxID=1265417 RepID=A0AAV8Z4R0_9CUCU|nr:hypothetical protein NQ318_006055 [Aromia moschata]
MRRTMLNEAKNRDFNKSYEDLEQEVHRFNIFKSNLKQILQHNEHYEEGLVTYTKRINKHGDLTEAEFLDFYGLLTSKTVVYNDTVNVTTSVNDGAPNFLDWREKGAVTSVKDQGNCGSCWIFGALDLKHIEWWLIYCPLQIGVLEGYYFRKHSKLISFSAQNMVDCISNYTCLGGLPEGVFFYVQKHRISADDDYPYEAKRGECKRINTRESTFPSTT